MGITILWDNKTKTTLRLDFEGLWSWEEYDSTITQASVLVQQAEYRVNIIHNFLKGSCMPLGYFLPHFQATLKLMEPNLDFIFIVGGSHSMQVLLWLFIETFTTIRHKVAFTDSAEEARRILAEQQQATSTA